MTLQLDLVQLDDPVEVRLSGRFSMSEALSRFGLLLDMMERRGSRGLLVDFTALEPLPGATTKVLYAVHVCEEYRRHLDDGGRPVRIAYLDDPARVSIFEPGRDHARAEGLPIELFTDRKKALGWLAAWSDHRRWA